MAENHRTLPQEVAEHLRKARKDTPWEGLPDTSSVLIDPADAADVGKLLTLHSKIIDELELIVTKLAFEVENLSQKSQ